MVSEEPVMTNLGWNRMKAISYGFFVHLKKPETKYESESRKMEASFKASERAVKITYLETEGIELKLQTTVLEKDSKMYLRPFQSAAHA